jgi:hypothetical protein
MRVRYKEWVKRIHDKLIQIDDCFGPKQIVRLTAIGYTAGPLIQEDVNRSL